MNTAAILAEISWGTDGSWGLGTGTVCSVLLLLFLFFLVRAFLLSQNITSIIAY